MNAKLIVEPNLGDHDAFYEMLVHCHQDLSEAQSKMLNARLILLLSNHIGNLSVLQEAFAIARKNVGSP